MEPEFLYRLLTNSSVEFLKNLQAIELPKLGDYGVGFLFLSSDQTSRENEKKVVEEVLSEEGLDLITWRTVPVNSGILGKAPLPLANQLWSKCLYKDLRKNQFRLGFRKETLPCSSNHQPQIEIFRESHDVDFHACCFSSRTLTYKGMLTTEQLGEYFPDLSDPDMESALALTHSRFSTNTFPSWPRAQPFRYICHNGEINTVRGNENWLYARQMQLASEVFGEDVKKLFPIIRQDGSDSQKFDNCLEFLTLSGRSLAHSMMMMIPEPWGKASKHG